MEKHDEERKYAVFERSAAGTKRITKALKKIEAGVYVDNLNESTSKPTGVTYEIREYLEG